MGKKILLALGIVVLFVGIGLAAAAGWALNIYDSAPSIDSLNKMKKGASSTIYAPTASGSASSTPTLSASRCRRRTCRSSSSRRRSSIEDHNFYYHGGIDPSAIIRAAVKDLAAGGKPIQGGSTITQQLVRNLYQTELGRHGQAQDHRGASRPTTSRTSTPRTGSSPST